MTLAEKWNGVLDEIITQCKTLDGLKDTLVNNGFNATTGTQAVGSLRAVEFVGLPNQKFIDSISLKVNVAAGNIRIKIYQDSGDKPDLFLGESGSIPVTKTGVVNFRLLKQVEVPIDGQVWVAFENDNATLDIDQSTGQASGTSYTLTHTFGVGPDPWSGGSSGTTPFWAQIHSDPKVVKHNGVRGTQPEDFYAVVWSGDMTVESLTGRGSNNTFITHIDVSYRGADFQDGLTKMLSKVSEIYDLIHMTTLNNQVQKATVDIFPDEVIEGENLYLIGTRVQVTATKLVMQA